METSGYKTATIFKNNAITQTICNQEDNKIEEQKMLCGIIGLIVKPKYIKDALLWLKRSNIIEKKGLKVIGKVIKHKGEKSFRFTQHRKVTERIQIHDISRMSANDAKIEFDRRNLKSCYETFYGRKPDLTNLGDADILKFNFFSELPCIRIFNLSTRNYLDNWQEKEKDEHFISQALTTLRSLYTFVFSMPQNLFKKFKEANKPINRKAPKILKKSMLIKTERCEKIIALRSKSVNKEEDINILFNKMMKSRDEISKFSKSVTRTSFQPIDYKYVKIDTRSRIQSFLNGSRNGLKMFPKMEMSNDTEYRNTFNQSSKPLTKSDIKNRINKE